MTVGECVEMLRTQSVAAVCVGETHDWLHITEQVFVILSSVALIVAAWVAYHQLKLINTQIKEAREGVLEQVDVAKANHRLAATLSLLMHQQSNEHWIQNRKKFVELRDSREGLKKHAQSHSEDAFTIRAQLNQYEMIAIGIELGILDEEMFRNYHRGTTLKDWTAAVQFVEEERVENDRYWREFQRMADKFKANPPV